MHYGTVPVRLIANELRHKFLGRYMATQTKKNHTTTRPKKNRPARAPRRSRASVAPKAPALRPTRPILKGEPPGPRDEELVRDDEEPKPEDLAKEAPIKPEEVEEATAVLETAVEAPAAAEPRTRERSGYDGDTAIKLYLREIGQVKLLTPQEEIELAARIKKGDKKAREQMIKANLRLVVKIARDYEGIGLPLLDLISEGNIGLMKAVERFDPAKGGKLSTYGSWWIKQSIKRALANQSKTIRLPVHLVDKISKMRRTAMR